MTRVFRVYDEDWEDIVGERQLKEFAFERVTCSPNGFTEGNIYVLNGEDKNVVIELAKKIRDTEGCFKVDYLTVEEAILIINESMHTVEELNVY